MKKSSVVASITSLLLAATLITIPSNAHADSQKEVIQQANQNVVVLSQKQQKTAAVKVYDQAFTEFKRGDQDAAITDLETASNLGNATVAAELGELYQNGFHEYTLKSGFDYKKARTWNSIAAAMGQGRGYTNNGILYYSGWGVKKNLNTAITNFKKGYALKDMKAPRYLGQIYDAKKNYKTAANYYQAAYKSGDITGGINLAQLYLDGNGVKKDTTAAINIYKKLLKDAHGNAKAGDAAVAWGDLYANGKYVKKDTAKAKTIYQKGVKLGSDAAKQALTKLN